MSDLRELYQQVILDHNKNPRNFHDMPDATNRVDGYNPLCGDHYTVFLKTEGETIREVSFTGSGCAISKASASVMSSTVKGKSKDEADHLFETFHRLVTGDQSGLSAADLGRLAAFSGVSEFPARVKCATLAWHTLRSALEGNDEKVSTE
ncbi:MAG TPA: SUF system NifU family Fe-S cluster assembly protein [Thermoanaerobaculia bacterium]|jgi:nitrogen fixation NifU-like protein|nr:SUF system NifU family Fe-S cluster assembly protein [Thermoanaerobaculia bacterium]